MTPTLDTLRRIDSGDQSLRFERSRFDTPHGPRTVYQVTRYYKTAQGRWVRAKGQRCSVRRHELARLAELLLAVAQEGE